MDITKYNFYYMPENDEYLTTTYRTLKTNTDKIEIWGNPKHEEWSWASSYNWENVKYKNYNEELHPRHYWKPIKPILYSCPKCNNKGCYECVNHFFSVFNKFNTNNNSQGD